MSLKLRRTNAAHPFDHTPRAQAIFDLVKAMREWRLGRDQMVVAKGKSLAGESTLKTVDEIILRLKRIRHSIGLWNKEGGRRGYLNFVSESVK